MKNSVRLRAIRHFLRPMNLWGYYLERELDLRARIHPALPSTRFLIFANGRTGSRLLCELLDSHSGIDCDLEMLDSPVRNVHRFVESLADCSTSPTYGFKAKSYHLTECQEVTDCGAFLRQLHDRGWKLIYLRRRNLFRHVYSGMCRRVRGTAHSRPLADGSTPPRPSVHLDVSQLLRGMAHCRETEQLEREALDGLPYRELVYEDDLYSPDDQQRSVNELVQWFGLEPEKLWTDMIRNTPTSLRSVISNFREVETALRGTEFEEYFREATTKADGDARNPQMIGDPEGNTGEQSGSRTAQ